MFRVIILTQIVTMISFRQTKNCSLSMATLGTTKLPMTHLLVAVTIQNAVTESDYAINESKFLHFIAIYQIQQILQEKIPLAIEKHSSSGDEMPNNIAAQKN